MTVRWSLDRPHRDLSNDHLTTISNWSQTLEISILLLNKIFFFYLFCMLFLHISARLIKFPFENKIPKNIFSPWRRRGACQTCPPAYGCDRYTAVWHNLHIFTRDMLLKIKIAHLCVCIDNQLVIRDVFSSSSLLRRYVRLLLLLLALLLLLLFPPFHGAARGSFNRLVTSPKGCLVLVVCMVV